MKIKKLQGGGMAPFMTYTPNVASDGATSPQQATAKEEKKDEGLLSKEMIKLIMEEGIPSDVDNFMSQLDQFGASIQGGLSSMDSTQMYSMLLPQLNKLKYNKEDLMKTRDNLYSNGGLNEAALTTNGGVAVRDADGNMSIISIEEYGNNRDKYGLLTNNDLLQMRSYDKNLAFNNNITSILKNGQGMNNVTKELQNVISQMRVQKEQKEGFMPAEQLEVLKGIDAIKGVVGVSMTQESSRVYKEHAKEYLYNTLPQNSKNLLKLKAAEKGISPKDMMELLILPSTEENSKEGYDLSKASGSGLGGSSESTEKDTWQTAYNNNTIGVGRDGKMTTHDFNLGDYYTISAPALKLNGILDAKSQNMLPTFSSIETIANQGFGLNADLNNIYFGNEKINKEKLGNIVSNGGTMSKVYLPIDQEALVKGEIKPDLDISRRLGLAEKEIKERGITDDIEKTKIYSKHQVGDYSNFNPENSPGVFAPFAAIPSWAQGEGVLKDKDYRFIKEIDDNDDVRAKLNEGKLGRKPTSNDKDYLKSWYNLFSDKNIYEGLTFIHTPYDAISATQMGGGLNIPKSAKTYESIIKNQMEGDRQMRYKNTQTSTNILDNGRN